MEYVGNTVIDGQESQTHRILHQKKNEVVAFLLLKHRQREQCGQIRDRESEKLLSFGESPVAAIRIGERINITIRKGICCQKV